MMWQLVPKPKSFLHFVSLKTGTEIICLFAVFNKASGIYGVLALLTGASITGWQLSMYLYSIIMTVLFLWMLGPVRRQEAVPTVLFAFAYVLDSAINIAYTAIFATSWFLVISQQGSTSKLVGAMNDTAGFTHPSHTVASVVVAPTPIPGTVTASPSESLAGVGQGALHPEQYPSIAALVLILLVKAYFVLVALSYARTLVIQYEEPNEASIQGRLYRLLTASGYWRGGKDDLRLSKARSSNREDDGIPLTSRPSSRQ
ncbi:Inositolphosphorylceramide synthase subunit Kei1-domain-containing protein [Protomyces lactucae-debilis]|uniref:Inositolphosphorylceramide synthase subunit Kei1-domain-containing protein n=1 Tax=Protomyces lactucae-debilis TaxID=2754530 RepID=A0A1Y2F492_PROLT|nr:Inositolphosphorylceramide synthase subunit Kei1-domain-containing protein [Protomyces lactucae-debilis]ORY78136.1 Inositolphosphorylceramide synthase subunit Kei1-domain-containing protein [Protomyces lactucae-debilis]